MSGEELLQGELIKPVQPDLIVDFVRHGEPEYTQQEIDDASIEGHLTQEGRRQVHETGLKLSEQIDKEKECVVFWVSPKQRAQQTAAVLQKVFEQQQIPVERFRTHHDLSDIRLGHEFIRKLYAEDAVDELIEYWTKADLPEDAEKPEEVKKRVERVVTYLVRIAEKIRPQDNKKLRFICVGHEEIFRDLLEAGYGFGTKKHTGPEFAEVMEMKIFKSELQNDAVLKLMFRGKEAELRFNPQSRNFYKIQNSGEVNQ
ncbi:hypothetical protein A3D78_05865 [Candidatus Gottesmanbacteria bacterium RIFCSPHIGHO2_02_FULL_39_14]|uniref:Phosphoglycerate mutase n=1 Tax=Candidatus Gottesmanbacteria bacterium RIFCSPHIGHO2_02_FULL_39_14 TaxID=1798383 RepID=A0A1F5ZZV2_9BACT|nr:MAG: hypothetical protein A3D78_05865 [Candidatus Gottesmanbacteria bacterium RIFCSPHIGHO2_02_FULL_39_14]